MLAGQSAGVHLPPIHSLSSQVVLTPCHSVCIRRVISGCVPAPTPMLNVCTLNLPLDKPCTLIQPTVPQRLKCFFVTSISATTTPRNASLTTTRCQQVRFTRSSEPENSIIAPTITGALYSSNRIDNGDKIYRSVKP